MYTNSIDTFLPITGTKVDLEEEIKDLLHKIV